MKLQPDMRVMTNDECQMVRSRHSLSGFALLEVIVVVAVLATVLVWLIIPRVSSGSSGGGHARSVAAMSDIKGGFKTAIDQYKVEIGSYPHALQDLVTQPAGATNWHGPYHEGLKDPWGNDYIYVIPGLHNPKSYDLYSMGPDGKAGTADDIGNWTKQ